MSVFDYVLMILFAIVATAILVGGLYVFRALCRGTANIVQQTHQGNYQGIRRGALAGLIAASCIFAITYLSAWSGLRPYVAIGPFGTLHMECDAHRLHRMLKEYAKEHGHYPDSIKDAFPKDYDPSSHKDPWDHPYTYTKTDDGYRLYSLGRDGKPSGRGLDADIDLPDQPSINITITLPQFLFQGGGSGTLFQIAFWASLCTGLICFILASLPKSDSKFLSGQIILAVLTTTFASFYVVYVLMALHLIGNHH